MNIAEMLNQNVVDMKPSGIRKFFDIVAKMPDAISLGVGEPDFITPWHIREAGIYSLEKGHTYYTSNSGLEELRFEIANYLNRRFNLSYNYKNEVLVTVGGSEAIDLAMRAFISQGDEVLIPEPCFVCYAPCVSMAGGKPVPIVTTEEDEFKLTASALKAAITPKTKMLVLAYPNNPTGAIMDKKDLEAIAEVLRDTNIIVLSDEIYAELTYGQKHVSIAEIDGMKERTLLASGFSKAFAMTGWRLGYICGNADTIKAMTKIHQYGIMSTPTTSQYAAIEAMKNGDDDVKYMVSEYDHRRKILVEELNNMGIHCFEPKGAFYAFPSIKSTGMTSEQFCEELLKDQKVAVVPGNAFGESGEGFVRISYAYSIDAISNALEKIDKFISKHK